MEGHREARPSGLRISRILLETQALVLGSTKRSFRNRRSRQSRGMTTAAPTRNCPVSQALAATPI